MDPKTRRWHPLVIAALAIGFWSQVFVWRSFLHGDPSPPAPISFPSPDWVPPQAIGCSGKWPPSTAPSCPRTWEIRQVVQVATPQ